MVFCFFHLTFHSKHSNKSSKYTMRQNIDIANFWEMVSEKGTYISISIYVYVYLCVSSPVDLPENYICYIC